MRMAYEHLLSDYEFRRAYNKGKSFVSPVLVSYFFKKRYGGIRMGITTGKKVGNAVHRNRSRRIIREAFSQLYPDVKGNYDIVFVARVKTSAVKMQVVRRDMLSHLKKAGLIKPTEEQK